MKKTLLTLGLYVLSFGTSMATITVTLGKGVDQGSLKRKVTVGDCINIGGGEKSISLSCSAGGNEKCPTNAELRQSCSGAMVVWLSNSDIDNGVSAALNLWDNGNGQQTGNSSQTFYNTGNGETALLTFNWITLPNGDIQITIDSHLI